MLTKSQKQVLTSFDQDKMAGEISQKLKVKTTKELTEQIKSLCDAHDLLVKKVNMLETELKETKEELKIWKKQCESKKKENQFQCTLCSVNFSDKGLLKKHGKENHGKNVDCKQCDKKFKEVWMLESHMKSHENVETFQCDVCNKDFYLKWRLTKHMKIHSDTSTKKCHYFNNAKPCPYEEVGCMFLHELSEACYHANSCRNKMCSYQHKIVEKNLVEVKKKTDTEKKSEVGHTVEKKQCEKENVQSEILRAFDEDSKLIFSVNKDCGLNNQSQKCGRCNARKENTQGISQL